MRVTHQGQTYYLQDAHDLWALLFSLALQARPKAQAS